MTGKTTGAKRVSGGDLSRTLPSHVPIRTRNKEDRVEPLIIVAAARQASGCPLFPKLTPVARTRRWRSPRPARAGEDEWGDA